MQHSLVFRLDGRGMAENQDFGNELSVHGRWLVIVLEQDHHAFAHIATSDLLECETGALSGCRGRYRDTFPLNTTDGGRGELAERVGADEDDVAGVDDA